MCKIRCHEMCVSIEDRAETQRNTSSSCFSAILHSHCLQLHLHPSHWGGMNPILAGSAPQPEATARILEEAGFGEVEVARDFARRERVVSGRRG